MARQQQRLGYPGAKTKIEGHVKKEKPVQQAESELHRLQKTHSDLVKKIEELEAARLKHSTAVLIAQAEAVLKPTPDARKLRDREEKKDTEYGVELARQRAALSVVERDLTSAQTGHQAAVFQGMLARGVAIRAEMGALADTLEKSGFTDREAWDKLVLLHDEYEQLPALIRKSGYPDYERPTIEAIYAPVMALAARCQAILTALTSDDMAGIARQIGKLPPAQLARSTTLRGAFHLIDEDAS